MVAWIQEGAISRPDICVLPDLVDPMLAPFGRLEDASEVTEKIATDRG
tara:strand:- start:3114 stop:3257 length:144 start_codon:yes stop_codon:yes gene_type:complete